MLKILFLDDIKCDKYIYVSWNGARNAETDSVYFDRMFASKMGIKSGDPILLQTVDDQSKLDQCTRCDIKPLSEADYQLVMLNADEIENQLLDQIRVFTTAFFQEDGDCLFNVYPIWLRSSINVPVFVKICNFEPKNKRGLILSNSAKLIIYSPGEDVPYVSVSEDNKSDKLEMQKSPIIKSMLGSMFRSVMSKVSPTESIAKVFPLFEKSNKNMSIPLYQGDSFLLRVIPSNHNCKVNLNYFTASISSKHFDRIRQYLNIKEKYCLFKLRKLLTTNELIELKKNKSSDICSVDTSSLSFEDKSHTLLVDKILKNFDSVTEFSMIIFENDNCPPDSIILNDMFRVEHSLSASSYVELTQIVENDLIHQVSTLGDIPYLIVPIASQITMYPLEITSDRFNEQTFTNKLTKSFRELLTSQLEFQNVIFTNNLLIVSFNSINFLVYYNQGSFVDLDRCDLRKLFLSCFIINPDTQILFKSVSIKFDYSKLLLNFCRDSKHIDRISLPTLYDIPTKPFGGFQSLFQQCEKFINIGLHISSNEQMVDLDSKNLYHNLFSTLLIVGPKGSGKTTLLERLQHCYTNQSFVFTKVIQCGSIRGKRIESLQKSWFNLFEEAVQRQPSILMFDDLDEISYEVANEKQRNSDDSNENVSLESVYCERVGFVFRRLVEMLQYLKSSSRFSRVVLIATSESEAALNKSIRNHNLFNQIVQVSPLSCAQRADIIREIVSQKDLSLPNRKLHPSIQFNVNRLSRATKQYQPHDLNVLMDVAFHDSLVKQLSSAVTEVDSLPETVTITEDSIKHALAESVPSHAKKVNMKLDSNKCLADVGGLDDIKDIIINTIMLPVRYPKIFSNLPLKAQKSVLLYGMPGTGKTILVEAIANESGLNFIGVKGPELLSKYIGASEQSVRQLFARAQTAAPCILFFDEFDSLAPRRGHDSTGVTDRIVNQMLTLLDGLEDMQRNVYILAATSRPDLIDLALLRPGRFDRCVRCNLPTEQERMEIIKILSRQLNFDFDSVHFDQIAKSTVNFTGADLQALLYNTYLCATRKVNLTVSGDIDVRSQTLEVTITEEDINEALNSTSPSLSEKERHNFDRM